MAEAKKCDRPACGKYYEEVFNKDSLSITSADAHVPDLCPECQDFLENWMKGKKTKKRKRKEWSPEAKKRAAERMKEKTDLAHKIQEEDPSLSWKEALSKAYKMIQEGKKEEKEEAESKPDQLICDNCQTNKIEEKGQMCEDCQRAYEEMKPEDDDD